MSYAAATLPQEHIQPRRIAATAVAIAVHVAVLMMLMMPASVPSTAKEEEQKDIWIPIKTVIKQPDPIPIVKEKPKPQPVQTKADIPIKEEQFIDTEEATAVSTKAEEQPEQPPTSFTTAVESGSPYVQLSVLDGPAPNYPAMAIRRSLQGTVMLRIHVDANGRPIEVTIEQSSGSRILDEAAMKQVKSRWMFVPAQKDGQATDAWGLLPVQFSLN